MRRTDRTRFRKDAEAKFPIKVDIPAAEGSGRRLAKMLTWCQANVAAGTWAQHGYMDWKRRDDRGIPIDFARWYFANEADAEAFRRQWQPGDGEGR